MTQKQETNGSWAYDTSVGELEIRTDRPETSDDSWVQAALTVEGKISNLDLIYAGSYLKRDVDTESDYSDYSYWYDTLLGYGAYWYDDNGVPIDPSQYIQGKDRYNRYTHELRLASDADQRFRFVGGRSPAAGARHPAALHDRRPRARRFSVTGWEDTIWLTKQLRVDKDLARVRRVHLRLHRPAVRHDRRTILRVRQLAEGLLRLQRRLQSAAPARRPAQVATHTTAPDFNGAPCKVFDKTTTEDGVTPRVNLTYKFTEEAMVYATYSEGFRPGGINRRGTLPPYEADWLTNYELGWKTTWFDNRLRFNGAVFSAGVGRLPVFDPRRRMA